MATGWFARKRGDAISRATLPPPNAAMRTRRRARSRIPRNPRFDPESEALFDRVPNPLFERRTVQAVDFLDSGRRGDVDFGEIVADHIDANENQAFRPEGGPDRGANIALATANLGLNRLAADMEIGARLPLRRHAQHRADRLAIDEDDALVALSNLGQIALHYDRLAVERGEALQERVEILVVLLDPKNAGAAIAEKRLQDDVVMLVAKRDDRLAIARNERRRHQPIEMGCEKLFGRVADARRVVHDEDLAAQMLEHMRRRDVSHVEGWILPHQDHVHLREIEGLERAKLGRRFRIASHLQAPRLGDHATIDEAQMPC